MRKRRIASLVLAVVLCATSVIPAYAAQSEESVTLTYDEIRNSSIEIQGDCVILMNQSSNQSADYARTRTQSESYTDSTSVVLFTESAEDASEIYDELTAIQEKAIDVSSARSTWDSGNSSRTTSSAVIGITLTLRVYYKYTAEYGLDWYKLTKVVASNNKSSSSSAFIGSGFFVSSQTLTCGVQGQNLEGVSGMKGFNATVDIGTNPTSYTYTAPSSWPTVCGDTGLLGATYKLTATRAGKTYSVEITNNVFNNLGG